MFVVWPNFLFSLTNFDLFAYICIDDEDDEEEEEGFDESGKPVKRKKKKKRMGPRKTRAPVSDKQQDFQVGFIELCYEKKLYESVDGKPGSLMWSTLIQWALLLNFKMKLCEKVADSN